MSCIEIQINGEAESILSGASLSDIIQQFGLPELGCVFSINNVVIPRSNWNTTQVNQGDAISLFQAFAGG
ncbi:sulfur carrier protein ThiS [Vibrio sp. SCSIO 43135]|uniref:sulfur carrier protein ThiS n=1 Tax=Vibrio sp. SCSIO 43135 TaxID=2819096 RepID=UPI0020755429|nr:sulfur carrier protein ThiS [Vibrio sp. SCSIO 43135]USD41118.1 sulfur carrier protein ThiS [Vibrio sp. SCSIO 43135]